MKMSCGSEIFCKQQWSGPNVFLRYQSNCLALACRVPSRTKLSRQNGTATMDFSSSHMAGMNLASRQSSSNDNSDMHLHPPTGMLVKRTPCRQAGLRLIRHADRLHAKLLDSSCILYLSNKILHRRLICRTRAKKHPTTFISSEVLPLSNFTRSLLVSSAMPGRATKSSSRALRCSGQTHKT